MVILVKVNKQGDIEIVKLIENVCYLKDSAGVCHLRKLSNAGLTHVHLLPTFQFAGVDDEKEMWKCAGKSAFSSAAVFSWIFYFARKIPKAFDLDCLDPCLAMLYIFSSLFVCYKHYQDKLLESARFNLLIVSA